MEPIDSPSIKAIEEAGGVPVKDRKGIRHIQGAGLRQLSTDIVLGIAEKFGRERVAKLLDELCEAKCITKGGHVIADNRTRLAALNLAMAYVVGRPVERQEIVSVNLDAVSSEGMVERLAASPALRAALKQALELAEAQAKAEAGPVVEG